MSTLTDDIARSYRECGENPELLVAVDRVLVAHHADAARSAFERGGVRDFLGREAEAIRLYREALDLGLAEPERLQCLVQLASSLRNVGDPGAAVEVLREARVGASAEGADWVDAFLALALHSSGRPAEALAVALHALAPHLTRYGRAVSSYADELD